MAQSNTHNRPNPFLQGPFAPAREELSLDNLEVSGSIPVELDGTLYRASSPAYFNPPISAKHHWFDGDGMIHAIILKDGKASVRNCYVDTPSLQAEKTADHAIYGSIMNGGLAPNLQADYQPIRHPGNTNTARLFGDVLAFSEGGLPYRMDPETLETRGMQNFGSIEGPVTAHFKMEPQSDEMLFYGVFGTMLTFYRADTSGRLTVSHSHTLDLPYFVHDFAVTRHFAIFITMPGVMNFENPFAGEAAFEWNDKVESKIGIMNMQTGDNRWFGTGQSFTTTHFANAYEENGSIIVDVNCTHAFETDASNGSIPFSPAFPWRRTLDLQRGKSQRHTATRPQL